MSDECDHVRDRNIGKLFHQVLHDLTAAGICVPAAGPCSTDR
ncbi:hypothetical protein AB0D78_39470 [Streptomyces avermitilis]